MFQECKIWEACRATSAATTFFDPITIGKFGQTFLDGGILYNNPIQLVHREAADIWLDRETLLISIGTGNAPGKPFKGSLKVIVERMRDIVTQTERTAKGFHRSHADMVNRRLLFRFNVHGMATIGLEEYKEFNSIVDRTETYLEDEEVRDKLKAYVARMKEVSSKGSDASS